MIKVLHAADLHLDSPFSGMTPEAAAARRREQRALPGRLVKLAKEKRCALMLLAGDLFDSDNVFPETLEAMQEAFAAFSGRIFIAPGNHDACLPGSAYLTAQWPENVHIFKKRGVEKVFLPEYDLYVYGAGFESAHEAGLLEGFRAPDDGALRVMVLHGDPVNPDSGYNPIDRAQIEASGLTYLALGHIHQASGLLRRGKTWYAWPGCAMGRGFDELGDKGAYIAALSPEEVRLEFVPLTERRYQIFRVPAGDDAAQAVAQALSQTKNTDICRVILTGESGPVGLAQLHAQFSGRVFALTLQDQTYPRRALWQAAQEDTLRGVYLRMLKAQYDAETDESRRRVLALAARLGLCAMEGREMTP